MSAIPAFQLVPPRDPKRDRSLDFLYGAEMDQAIAEQMTTCYGVDTRSYNRSGVKRELERIAERAKERAALDPCEEYLVPLMCACPQRPYPHEVEVHEKMRGEFWRAEHKFSWPWSLCLSERRELSTERRPK